MKLVKLFNHVIKCKYLIVKEDLIEMVVQKHPVVVKPDKQANHRRVKVFVKPGSQSI